jgi:hypothetical protein
MLLALGFATMTASHGAAQTPGTSAHHDPPFRIRTTDPELAEVLQDAIPRSRTLKRLVDAVERSDGLVYLWKGACPHKARACLLMHLEQAGPNRLLHIHSPPGKRGVDAAGSIAHELQHVVEVLSDPRVKTTDDLFALYYRIGLDGPASWVQNRNHGRFETAAAQEIGLQVRNELSRGSR